MNIEETLKELGNYFKNKIISGDFEFKKCTEYLATVRVDDKYDFDIWIANTPRENLKFTHNILTSENNSFEEYFSFRNNQERLSAWKKLKPHVDRYKSEVLEKEIEEEIIDLKNQIHNLEKQKS